MISETLDNVGLKLWPNFGFKIAEGEVAGSITNKAPGRLNSGSSSVVLKGGDGGDVVLERTGSLPASDRSRILRDREVFAFVRRAPVCRPTIKSSFD